MMHSVLALITRRPGRVLLSFGAALLLAVLVTGLLRFNQDIYDVLPTDSVAARVITRLAQATDDQGRIYIILSRADGAADPDGLLRTGAGLVDALNTVSVDGRRAFLGATMRKAEAVDPARLEETLLHFLGHPATFIAAGDVPDLAAYLGDAQRLKLEIARNLAIMGAPGGDQRMVRIVSQDPLGLRRFMFDKLARMQGGLTFADRAEMLAPDGRALMLTAVVAPDVAAGSGPQQALDAVDALKRDFPDHRILVTGGLALAVQQKALLQRDLVTCLAGSFLGVMALFLFAYRRPLVLLFVAIPLGVGMQLALGTLSIIVGQVHMLAVAFSAVILGLGIDFAIHVYDRYADERLHGHNAEEAVAAAVASTGRAVAVGGLTSIAAFLALAFAGSPVLTQIGLLVALGLFFCLITTLWALPAWLVWTERFAWSGRIRPFRRFGADTLGRFVQARPWTTLLICAAVLCIALPGYARLGVEKDMNALSPKGLEAVEARDVLFDHFGNPAGRVFIPYEASDLADLWQRSRQVDNALEPLEKSGTVEGFTSLSELGSPPGLTIPGIDSGSADAALQAYGFSLDDFPQTAAFLRALQNGLGATAHCDSLETRPGVFKRYFECRPHTTGVTWVNCPDASCLAAVSRAIAPLGFAPAAYTVEGAVDSMLGRVIHDVTVTASFAAGLALLILAVYFRSPTRMLLALAPTLLGLATALGLMGYAGVSLNMINFISIPILLGIGLDDGILLLHRHHELGDVRATLATTGRSICMTSLTTCLGFGSLALARYHVLAGMGLLTIAGVLGCLFFSACGLGAVLSLKDRRAARRAA